MLLRILAHRWVELRSEKRKLVNVPSYARMRFSGNQGGAPPRTAPPINLTSALALSDAYSIGSISLHDKPIATQYQNSLPCWIMYLLSSFDRVKFNYLWGKESWSHLHVGELKKHNTRWRRYQDTKNNDRRNPECKVGTISKALIPKGGHQREEGRMHLRVVISLLSRPKCGALLHWKM